MSVEIASMYLRVPVRVSRHVPSDAPVIIPKINSIDFLIKVITESNLKINYLDRATIFKIFGASIIVFSCILAIISKPIIFVDDAWITFRYAHNLAYNGQLTFNLNERVEGITNALWAIILAPQIRFFSIPVVITSLLTSLLLTAFSLYRIWKIGLLLIL